MIGRKFLFLLVALVVFVIGWAAINPSLLFTAEESRLRPGAGRRLSNERILRGVLTIYIWKMTDAVKLTAEQAAQIFPQIREAFRIRWQLAEERRDLLRLFRRAIDKTPRDEKELGRLLSQWEENEGKLHAAREKLREGLRSVLTSEQQARSVLFEEQFEGELARVIAQMRQEKSQQHLLQQSPGKER